MRTDILFFAGIKHSGKTTMARLCARRLGIPYFDSDDILLDWLIHHQDPRELPIDSKSISIRSFYRLVGVDRFMEAEAKALEDFIAQENFSKESPLDTGDSPTDQGSDKTVSLPYTPKLIISLGGGACDNEALMDIVSTQGICCYLANQPQVLLKRILKHGVPPFLDPEDVEGSFERLYERRDGIYRSTADFVIQLPDCEDPEDTCAFLLEALGTAMACHHTEQ